MRGLRAAVVLLLALTVQAAVVAELPVAGVRANVVLLVPIVAALLEGPDRGAVAGFVAGVAVDLLVQTPFGLSALAYCLAGYAVGAAQAGVLRASWWLPVVAAIGGSAIGIVAFALVGAVIGVEDVLNLELVRVVAVVGALNALLVAPALRLARWVEGPADRARMAIR